MSSPERSPALKPGRDNADREDMAIDPLQTLQLTAGPPLEVTHLGVVPDESVTDPALEGLAELRRRLETERSASAALLAAMRELERRLEVERSAGESLQSEVRELDGALEAERTELRAQRVAMEELWAQIRALNDALVVAERPLWRKLLRRP